jgi:hypothetical protein
MTFDLASWRDTVISGKLPVPTRTGRWQPLRAGLVNLWEYDAAEVWYADGRLQLQGANESGKSTLMTLTTLLLLAGNISSENIDTLGQTAKRFRYYVEPTDHALDRRDATRPRPSTAAGPGSNSAAPATAVASTSPCSCSQTLAARTARSPSNGAPPTARPACATG